MLWGKKVIAFVSWISAYNLIFLSTCIQWKQELTTSSYSLALSSMINWDVRYWSVDFAATEFLLLFGFLQATVRGVALVPYCSKVDSENQNRCCIPAGISCENDGQCCDSNTCIDVYGGKNSEDKTCMKACKRTGQDCLATSECCGGVKVNTDLYKWI